MIVCLKNKGLQYDVFSVLHLQVRSYIKEINNKAFKKILGGKNITNLMY